MTLYVDSNVLLKRYVDEHDSEAAVGLMATDPVLVTARLSEIEVRRNLSRLLSGRELEASRQQFTIDLDALALVSIDAFTCNHAARIAEQSLCRSLDAIHLATALRAGSNTTVLTFDQRQGQAARAVGLAVIGA